MAERARGREILGALAFHVPAVPGLWGGSGDICQ